MSQTLQLEDVVLVKRNKVENVIGLVKYIGPIVDMMSQFVGLELLESITDGHNGTINNFTYFTAPNGYGYHTKITNIIQKLSVSDLFKKLKKCQNHLKKIKKMLKKKSNKSAVTPPHINTNLPRLNLTNLLSNQSISSQSKTDLYAMTPITPSYKEYSLQKQTSQPHLNLTPQQSLKINKPQEIYIASPILELTPSPPHSPSNHSDSDTDSPEVTKTKKRRKSRKVLMERRQRKKIKKKRRKSVKKLKNRSNSTISSKRKPKRYPQPVKHAETMRDRSKSHHVKKFSFGDEIQQNEKKLPYLPMYSNNNNGQYHHQQQNAQSMQYVHVHPQLVQYDCMPPHEPHFMQRANSTPSVHGMSMQPMIKNIQPTSRRSSGMMLQQSQTPIFDTDNEIKSAFHHYTMANSVSSQRNSMNGNMLMPVPSYHFHDSSHSGQSIITMSPNTSGANTPNSPLYFDVGNMNPMHRMQRSRGSVQYTK